MGSTGVLLNICFKRSNSKEVFLESFFVRGVLGVDIIKLECLDSNVKKYPSVMYGLRLVASYLVMEQVCNL